MKQITLLIICIVSFGFIVACSEGKSEKINYHDLVNMSDDYAQHKEMFANSARKLITSNRCSTGDFVEMGGWIKSSNHLNQPVYFTYCGGLKIPNKVYLNAVTGKIYKLNN